MYTLLQAYKGLIYYFRTIVPSGVDVVEGEDYGIRLDDPTGLNPSVAVTMGDINSVNMELGSAGTSYMCSCVINAKSRVQRDALKQIVYGSLVYTSIPYHEDYDADGVPIGAVIGELEVQDTITVRNMPNFDSDREKFFWTAVVTFTVRTVNV